MLDRSIVGQPLGTSASGESSILAQDLPTCSAIAKIVYEDQMRIEMITVWCSLQTMYKARITAKLCRRGPVSV
jgi:hypothetical protein